MGSANTSFESQNRKIGRRTIWGWSDGLIPAGLKDDPRTAHRARLLLRGSMVLTVLTALSALISGLLIPDQSTVVAAPFMWSAVAFAAVPMMLRWTGNLEFLSSAVVGVFLICVLTLVATGDGVRDPVVNLLIVLPILASMLGGVRVSSVMTAVAALALIVFVAMDLSLWAGAEGSSGEIARAGVVAGFGLLLSYLVSGSSMSLSAGVHSEHLENEARYTGALGLNNVGVFEWHIAGKTTHYSARLQHLLGLTKATSYQDALPVPGELVHEDDQISFKRALDDHFVLQTPLVIAVRLRSRGGAYRWYHVRAGAEWTSKGIPTRLWGVVYDNHEEQARQAAREDELEASRHELLQAYTATSGAMKLARDATVDSAGRDRLWDVAERNLSRLNELMAVVYDTAGEAQELSVSMEQFEIDWFLAQSAAINKRAGKKRDVSIDYASTAKGQLIQADINRLHEVMTALVRNAVAWSPPQQAVTVRCERVSEGVQIRVADRGDGIPASMHHLVFQPSSAMVTEERRAVGERGLDLFQCQQLVERMGGELGFFSKEGNGTTFFLRLQRP